MKKKHTKKKKATAKKPSSASRATKKLPKKKATKAKPAKTSSARSGCLITLTGILPMFDHEDKKTNKPEHLKLLDGFIESDYPLLEYLDRELLELELSGGFLHCRFDAKSKKLLILTDYVSSEPLSKQHLKQLVENTSGQWSDGVGEGCFDSFTEHSGFSVNACVKPKVAVGKGKATTPETFGASNLEERWRQAFAKNRPKGKKGDLLKLMKALMKGKLKEAEELYRHGVDLNSICKCKGDDYTFDGETPLTLAAKQNKLRAIRWLLDHGADVHARQEDGHQAVHLSARLAVLEALLEAGANPKSKSAYVYRQTPLHFDNNLLDADSTALLIERGANVNAVDCFGKSVLMYAASVAAHRAVELLLEAGAKVNQTAKVGGETALKEATGSFYYHRDDARGDRGQVVRLLVDAGAKVTPKVIAEQAMYCNYEMMRPMLEAGVDINAKVDGKTLLAHLASSQDQRMIPLLLEFGADPRQAKGAVSKALAYGDTKAVRALVAAGSPVTVDDVARAEKLLRSVAPLLRKACAAEATGADDKQSRSSSPTPAAKKKSQKKATKKKVKKFAAKRAPTKRETVKKKGLAKKAAGSSSKSTGGERTFELRDGKSNKFWAIEVSGDSHTTTYGRIGASGSSTTKSFASDAAAKEAAEKLIAQKVKKGYREQ